MVEVNFSCSTTNQKHYPEPDSDALSVWNFCACFSEAISRGNQWRCHELSAFLSGLSVGVLRKFPIFSVWQLRAAIAPCMESVFLLDRLCYLHEKVLFYIRHLDSLYLFMSWHNVFFMRFCCVFLWTQILKLSRFIHILFVCLYCAFIFLLESQHYTCSRSYNRLWLLTMVDIVLRFLGFYLSSLEISFSSGFQVSVYCQVIWSCQVSKMLRNHCN